MDSRSPRGSLSPHVVFDTALALIDREGLDGLSVRGLAAELGRPPMTLYAHFDSKRALLDLAFDHLVQRLFRSHQVATWREELETGCRHARRQLLEHPHWISLLTRVRVPPSSLRVYERLLELMANAGFRPEAAMFSFSVVMSHAIGSVLAERMMAGTPPVPKQRLELVKGMVSAMPHGAYPRIARASRRFDDWSFDRVFEVGLQAILDGLDDSFATRERASRRPR